MWLRLSLFQKSQPPNNDFTRSDIPKITIKECEEGILWAQFLPLEFTATPAAALQPRGRDLEHPFCSTHPSPLRSGRLYLAKLQVRKYSKTREWNTPLLLGVLCRSRASRTSQRRWDGFQYGQIAAVEHANNLRLQCSDSCSANHVVSAVRQHGQQPSAARHSWLLDEKWGVWSKLGERNRG